MLSPHETAERIVNEWYMSDEWRPDSNTHVLVNKIEQALHQAHEEGRKEMREDCADIARKYIGEVMTKDPIQAGKNIVASEICNEIAQKLREMK